DAHSVTDQTQGNWNGIVGKLELRAGAKTWIEDAQAYPDVANHRLRLEIALATLHPAPPEGTTVVVSAHLRGGAANAALADPAEQPTIWNESSASASVVCNLGPDAKTWDEFSPNLYDVTIELRQRDAVLDTRHVTFGLRELGTRGTQFTLNG